jgi:hypothetical protein
VAERIDAEYEDEESPPPYRERLRNFWGTACRHFYLNLKYAWPAFVALIAWVFASGLGLWAAEKGDNREIQSYWDGVFYTYMAMYGENISPATSCGKILYVADALAGFILLGLVIWFINKSLD